MGSPDARKAIWKNSHGPPFRSGGLSHSCLTASFGSLRCTPLMHGVWVLLNTVRRQYGVLVLLVIACGSRHAFAGNTPEQWVVVTPPSFRTELAPLIEHRKAEGFKVVVVETTDVLKPQQMLELDGAPLQARLKELFQPFQGRNYLLLAGVFGTQGKTNLQESLLPPLRGTINRMKGQATDSGYGFPNTNGMPSVAVGRFPARTAEELRGMVQKTLAFENSPQPADWRNRLLLLIGNPGGGALAEMFMEQSLRTELAVVHPSWDVRMLINISSSRYYLPRPLDGKTALSYLEEGQAFSVYLGHSGAVGMGLDARFISRADWEKLNIPQGRGPFFTCGCFACQSNERNEGYGLSAARNPTGPVAVIGATGESYSAPGELAAEGLLTCLTQPPFPLRLADYWLAIEAGLARGKMDPGTFGLLDMADGTGGKVPLATQRLEHLEMWMLLGDPALRMPLIPEDISLKTDGPICPGKPMVVNGTLPERLSGSAVKVTLERPLSSAPLNLEKIPANSPENREARERAFIANYQRANSFVLATAETKASGTHFDASLEAPVDVPWSNIVVRASATSSNEAGLGIVVVPAKPPTVVEQAR